MKSAIPFAAAALLSFGGAAGAASWHLTPLSTNFVGKGRTQATKNGITLPCKAKFNGNIDGDGTGHITSGTFSGQIGCESVSLGNLPWTATATAKNKGVIHNVAFTTPIGACGPGDMPVKITTAGTIIFTNVPLAGGCTVSGKLKTSPVVGTAKN
jgi:hypothetical protein